MNDSVVHEDGRMGPVAIGGVGGSGTRVVAEIISRAGLYLGDDLNDAMDDLWFNLLFYRPSWFLTGAARRRDAIHTGLDLMAKRSRGSRRLSFSEARFLVEALADIPRNGFSRTWALHRLLAFGRSPGTRKGKFVGWGWKEPSTHLILEELLNHSEHSMYVHVVRHGLDMSFSSNLNQVRRFGPLFGVQLSSSVPLPVSALRYWIESNRRAVDIMRRRAPERTLIVRFDELCESPESEVRRLLRFLHMEPGRTELRELVSLPRAPASAGRYRAHDLAMFAGKEIEAVREFGFEVQL